MSCIEHLVNERPQKYILAYRPLCSEVLLGPVLIRQSSVVNSLFVCYFSRTRI